MAPESLGIYFNPQRSWAPPFRAFLLPVDRKDFTVSSLRSCAFRQNLYSLASALQRVAPARKAVPLFAPEGLVRDGDVCSLELSDLSGSLSIGAHVEVISPSTFPSRSYEAPTLRFGTSMIHRVLKHRQLGLFPFTGADLSGLPDLDELPAP